MNWIRVAQGVHVAVVGDDEVYSVNEHLGGYLVTHHQLDGVNHRETRIGMESSPIRAGEMAERDAQS